MDSFRVWVRPTDYGYCLLVDGSDNANWLLDRLGRSFVFRSAQPIAEDFKSSLCTFEVPSAPLLSFGKLKKLLTDIPEVTLLQIAAAT